jgi:hypothetical protein
MARRGSSGWVTLALIAGVLSAPVVVFVAVFGVSFGWWSRFFALHKLTWGLAPWLFGLGTICGLVLLWRGRRGGLLRVLSALVAVTVVGVGAWLYHNNTRPYSLYEGAPQSVSTNPSDPPLFSTRLMAERLESRGAQEQDLEDAACPGVESIPTQVLAEEATAALQRAGFTPLPSSLFRVEGTHTGLWFQIRHDVTIRIRPGRTDVRVAVRDDLVPDGQACRLLARIVEELQPRS